MATINRFEQIISWEEARKLNKRLGNLIDSGRFKRSYKLIQQIEGSAGSIMDNIAEGFERGGKSELIHFLSIAKASNAEVKSQLYRLLDHQYIDQDKFDTLYQLATEIGSKLGAWIIYLNESEIKGLKFKNRATT